MAVRAVISDFGGVLTTPLAGGFANVQRQSGITAQDFGAALAALGGAGDRSPLDALETGSLRESAFVDAVAAQLADQLGRTVTLDGFGEMFFDGLSPNEPYLDHLARLHDRGMRLAICTNNVREWSRRWQAMIPRREIFDVIVDSSEVGARKPDPRIYEVVLSELAVEAREAVFVDDLEVNCAAAADLGMHAVWFRDTAQAIADVETALAPRA